MGVHYNITIVPKYTSNFSLENNISAQFSQLIDGNRYHGNKTLRIIVFRPTGRPADEFRDNVLPVLQGCDDGVYLLAAFSGGYKNISDLVPESVRHRVRSVEPIFIQSGELVSEASGNYTNNQAAIRRMAQQMCSEHGLTMIQATKKRDRTPEAKQQKSSTSFRDRFRSSKDNDDMSSIQNRAPPVAREPSYKPAHVNAALNTEDSVLLAGLLHDSPVGIPLPQLCEIMKLRESNIRNILDQSTVFKRNPIGGKEYICLSQNLKYKLTDMKEGEAYIECMKNQHRNYTPSTTSLTELKSMEDNLDPLLLKDLDKHFNLDGKLPEILVKVFELFLEPTETNMDTAPSPLGDSLTGPDKRADPDPQPVFKPYQEGTPDPCLHPDQGLEQNMQQTQEAEPNLDPESGRNDGQTPESSAREGTSATDTFLLFLGQISSRPETLQQDLVELIEQELHIPGKLLSTLNIIHTSQKGPDVSQSSVGCSRFLQIIENPAELTRLMREAAQEELGLTEENLEHGLRRICEKIKETKPRDV